MSTEMKEFDDLIAALRDERPQIDPGFARELDTRAAAGFGKPRRRLRFPRISLMVGAPAAVFSVLIALVVAASMFESGSSDESTGGSAMTAAEESAGAGQAALPELDAPDQRFSRESRRGEPLQPLSDSGADANSGVVEQSASSVARAAAPSTSGNVAGGARGRLQEQSATLTLIAPPAKVAETGDEILGVVDNVGGFVVSSNVRATDGTGGGGDFQLRIPTERLDEGLAQLSRLAHVRERSQSTLDITVERNVARERLEEGRAERVALLNRLAEATTQTEIDAIKAQISNLNQLIGGARADLRSVIKRAQFAAVTVMLYAEGADDDIIVPDDGQWTPGDAVRDAGRVLEVIAGVLVIVGAVLVPLALLAAAFAATRRVAGRRGRERVLDAV